MHQSTALPLSPTYAVALARIADLRAQAEREQLVRSARSTRRRPAWPAVVVAALRDGIAQSRLANRAIGRGEPCPTC